MGFIHDRFSELEDKQDIVAAALARFRDDFDWRKEMLGSATALDDALALFEATSSDTLESGIPRVNLIRRAVEDFLSVTLENIPKARLEADKFVPHHLPPELRDIRIMILDDAEAVHNAYVSTIMRKGQYQDKIQFAIWLSAIFGVGYFRVEVDRSLNTRKSYELRKLLKKSMDDLTVDEARRLQVLGRRIDFSNPDPRDVYWEAGKRRADETMLRVSMIERESTMVLRKELEGKVDNPELIRPGKFPYEIGETSLGSKYGSKIPNDTLTAVLTMWELEPVEKVTTFEDAEDGEVIEQPFNDYILHKIVIAGGELVEHEMTTGVMADEDADIMEEGVLQLPIIPVYVRESADSPYGFSMPLMLKLTDEFINLMRGIIYKGARKAVSTQGVVVAIPNLGDSDLDELETVLEEGGVGRIFGNSQTPFDVREMVMPLSFNQAPINPALVQALSMETDSLKTMGQAVDPGDLRQARTGAAKRAQIAASDRPKSLSINFLSTAVETIMELVYENVRVHHNDEIGVMVDVPGGGSEYLVLNETFERTIIVQDPEAVTPTNPQGFRLERFIATINDTSIEMYAKSEGRSDLPLDMIARFQILVALQQAGILEANTVRRLTLDEGVRQMDDIARNQRLQQEAALQSAQAAAQGMSDPRVARQVSGGRSIEEAAAAPSMGDVMADQAAAFGNRDLAAIFG